MRLQDNREDFVRRGIRLRNDAPQPELVQDLNEGLVVVLPQRGIELAKHRHFDTAEICYACHNAPLSNRQGGKVKKHGAVHPLLAIQKLVNGIRYGVDIEGLVENEIRHLPDLLLNLIIELTIDSQENDWNLEMASP